MPGGRLHWPLWVPYELYGRIDHIYGLPAWESQNGFTAAQGTLNAFETAAYIYYLVTLYRQRGHIISRRSSSTTTPLATVRADDATMARAVLLVFATFAVTCAKTVLYALNEHHSGYRHVRHNFDAPLRLLGLWILPNGPWIVLPGIFAYLLGREIVGAMTEREGKGEVDVRGKSE